MTTQEKPNQKKRGIPEAMLAPYRDKVQEFGNGHWLFYDLDVFGRGEERCTYFLLRVFDDATGKMVAMSMTPQPDEDARREFTVDFLIEEKK